MATAAHSSRSAPGSNEGYQSLHSHDPDHDYDHQHHKVNNGRCTQTFSIPIRTAIAVLLVASMVIVGACILVVNRSSTGFSGGIAGIEDRFINAREREPSMCDSDAFTKKTLKLAKREPFAALLARTGGSSHRYEASDITKVGQYFYVVFDNLFAVGRIDINLPFNSGNNWLVPEIRNGVPLIEPDNLPPPPEKPSFVLNADSVTSSTPVSEIRQVMDQQLTVATAAAAARSASPMIPMAAPVADARTGDSGYEAIAHDKIADMWYVIQESVATGKDDFHASIDELQFNSNITSYKLRSTCYSEWKFNSLSRGFEGAFGIHRDGIFYLVGLCEGNFCDGSGRGKEPGNGRLVVMRKYVNADGCEWRTDRVLHLPSTAEFVDYSAATIYHDKDLKTDVRLVVASQESAMVWVGRFDIENWKIYDYEKPRTYHFPRNDDCEIIHCNIEGVHVLEDGMLAVVSDKMKGQGRQPFRCLAADQSLSVFVVPE